MATKNKSEIGILNGVFAFAKIARPDFKYQSKDTEYSVQIIVDEDEADEWDEKFKKQPAKKIKVADFESIYKFPCPIQGAKNVYAITLKRDAVVDGEEFFPETRPKVLLDTTEGRVDITESRLIANGSKGKVSYRVSSNDYGTFARLQNILMNEEDFIEYESNYSAAGAEFGEEKPVTKEAPRKEITEARKPREEQAEKEEKPIKEPQQKSPKRASRPVQNDMDDDIPF
jgi:hypothetical protein